MKSFGSNYIYLSADMIIPMGVISVSRDRVVHIDKMEDLQCEPANTLFFPGVITLFFPDLRERVRQPILEFLSRKYPVGADSFEDSATLWHITPSGSVSPLSIEDMD